MPFWAHPCKLHGGLICITFCLSVVCLSVWTWQKWEKIIHISGTNVSIWLCLFLTTLLEKFKSANWHGIFCFDRWGSLPTSSCISFYFTIRLQLFFNCRLNFVPLESTHVLLSRVTRITLYSILSSSVRNQFKKKKCIRVKLSVPVADCLNKGGRD